MVRLSPRRPDGGGSGREGGSRSGLSLRSPPDHEPDRREDAVEHIHEAGRVVAGAEQQRHPHHVHRDPDEPELGPALRHAVGREQRPDEGPGVGPDRLPRTQGAEQGGERHGPDDEDDDQTDAGPGRRPPRHDATAVGIPPADPSIDRDGDEHDLPPGLTEQMRERRVGAQRGSEEHREQQEVADDADRPRPDLAPHAAEGARESERVPDDLTHQERLPTRKHPGRGEGVDEPLQEAHR